MPRNLRPHLHRRRAAQGIARTAAGASARSTPKKHIKYFIKRETPYSYARSTQKLRALVPGGQGGLFGLV